MKKVFAIIGLSLVLTACTGKNEAQSDPTSIPASITIGDSQQTSTGSTTMTDEDFTRISQVLSSGEAVKCSMNNDTHSTNTEYVQKGKKLRVTTTHPADPDKADMMISDGSMMYIWVSTATEGVKMKIPTEEEMQAMGQRFAAEIPDFSQTEQRQKYLDDGFSISCTETSVTDADFTPPSSITFADMTAMSESARQMMQNGQR